MKLEELYLQEAMSAANVDMSLLKKKDDHYYVKTSINDIPYLITFYQGKLQSAKNAGAKDNWVVQFRVDQKDGFVDALRKDSQDRLNNSLKKQNFNNGMEFKLMPTVIGYIKGFVTKFEPDSFSFGADEKEASRVSLYRAVAKRYSRELKALGYRLLSDDETAVDKSDIVPFVFVRNN